MCSPWPSTWRRVSRCSKPETAGRGASSISSNALNQPDLEPDGVINEYCELRSDREWRAPAMPPLEEREEFRSMWRYLRGVQHRGVGTSVTPSKGRSVISITAMICLSRPCGDHARAPQRSAPARSPGCAKRYLGARGTNDPAGCGDHSSPSAATRKAISFRRPAR